MTQDASEVPDTAAAFPPLPLAKSRFTLRQLPLDDYMQNEWTKPREYSFTNAAGEVFHEIAYSRQDVNTLAKMHKGNQLQTNGGPQFGWLRRRLGRFA